MVDFCRNFVNLCNKKRNANVAFQCNFRIQPVNVHMSYEKIIMLGKKMVSVIFKMMLIQIDFYVYKLETVCIVLCVL